MSVLQKVFSFTMTAVSNHSRKNFYNDLTKAVEIHNETLFKILERNKDTEYGKLYGFSSIRTIEEFKANIPLTTYDNYEEYINRLAKGEKNILTFENIEYFGVSSGTTGSQKMIPCTKSSLRLAAKYMGILPCGILYHNLRSKWSFGRGLNLMDMKVSCLTEGGIPKSSGSSGGMRSMRPMIPYIWTSPPEMLDPHEKLDSKFFHLLFALKEKDLMHIGSPFISSILDIFRYLEQNWESLTNIIETGIIGEGISISDELRDKLQQKLRPDSKRAAELRAEFLKGFDNIASRIWPKLIYIMSIAGASFKIYADKLKLYTVGIPIYSGLYGATESTVGICLNLDSPAYTIIPDAGYFEFIPFDEADSPSPNVLGIDQIKVGESYEIVVTGFSGLYRYRLGDIVRVNDIRHKSPELEFLFRRNQLLNIAAEKTSEQAVYHAVVVTFKRLEGDFIDFTIAEDSDTSPGKYVFYIEMKNSGKAYKEAEIKTILEEELCKANPAYQRMRNADKIGHLELKIVKPTTYESLKSILLSNGASSNQLKIPRVISNEKLAEFLRKNIISIN